MQYIVLLCFLLALLSTATSFLALQNSIGKTRTNFGALSASFYDIVEKDNKGMDVKFDKFRGKVIYGVNVASKCGYTSSGYKLLEKISNIDGVEVALFPSNQFGGQEPGTNAEIEQFCALKQVKGANIFDKADVNGANARPTYKYLKDQGILGNVAWNFAGKFLVDKEGNVQPVKSEKELMTNIEALLKK